MKIILIYLLLFTFYIDQVLGGVGISHMLKGLSVFNLNLYLLFIVWAVIVAIQKRKVFQSNNLNKYIVLMGFVVLTSIFVKIHRGEIPNISIKSEIIDFKQWLNPVLLFFILFNIIDDEETCNRTLLGLCFLFLALILTQLSATFGITDYAADSMARHGRAGGFGAAGEYSISLVLFFPFVLSGSLFMKRSSLFKVGCKILAFFILVGLVNAGSRNGAVSFFFSMVVYLLILKRKKIMGMLPITLLIIGMIVAGTTAFVVSPSSVKMVVSERFDLSGTEDLNKFASGRTELWKNAWRLFVDSPFIGHGSDSFMILSMLRGYRYYGVPHNEYLGHLAEYGLIGLTAFFMIFFKIFQNIWQSLETTANPSRQQLYISYIAGLFGFIVGMFFTNTGPSLYIFWIYTAVIYKYAQLDMDKKEISVGKTVTVETPSPL